MWYIYVHSIHIVNAFTLTNESNIYLLILSKPSLIVKEFYLQSVSNSTVIITTNLSNKNKFTKKQLYFISKRTLLFIFLTNNATMYTLQFIPKSIR